MMRQIELYCCHLFIFFIFIIFAAADTDSIDLKLADGEMKLINLAWILSKIHRDRALNMDFPNI